MINSLKLAFKSLFDTSQVRAFSNKHGGEPCCGNNGMHRESKHRAGLHKEREFVGQTSDSDGLFNAPNGIMCRSLINTLPYITYKESES